MSEKQSVEPGQSQASTARADVNSARLTAEAQRRWDEIRQMRDQIASRQEQVIQQTRADVRRHVERMRHVRQSVVTSEPPRPAPKTEPVPKKPSEPVQPIPTGPRFDFDSRRAAWEQRRREQAEKRQADMERARAPYLEQRRLLEEKRRLALLEQEALRAKARVGDHQAPPPVTKAAPTVSPVDHVVDVEAVDPIVIDNSLAFVSIAIAPEIVSPSLPYQQSLFNDEID